MRAISGCIQSIKLLMDEIAAASVQQPDMISLVESGGRPLSYNRAIIKTADMGMLPLCLPFFPLSMFNWHFPLGRLHDRMIAKSFRTCIHTSSQPLDRTGASLPRWQEAAPAGPRS